MDNVSGQKPSLKVLPHVKDRITFLYVEKCEINRESNALKFSDIHGDVLVPSAIISALILGPGTSITHRAVELAGDSGISIVWAGENGVRFYAGGRSLSSNTRFLQKQAEFVSNQRKHLDIVRKMYAMRFPDEKVDGLTLQQLRGKEGSRMRKAYAQEARKWGIDWNGRNYDTNSFSAADPVNQALSAGNTCLYGVVHAVVCSLGLSPGLGFIHIGAEKSFLYDIADLYKAEITIPLAFELAYRNQFSRFDISSEMRRRMRTVMAETHFLERVVKDIYHLFSTEEDPLTVPEIQLWNNYREPLNAGVMYS